MSRSRPTFRSILALALSALAIPAGVALAAPAAFVPDRPASPAQWLTDYEKSGGLETPRYDATLAYCQRLAAGSPWLRYESYGTSPLGRPLPLLIADSGGRFTPEAVRASGNAVLLIQACIHAGEPDGKDAGLMLLRDIAAAPRAPKLLEHVTVLFLPIFNVDGHERFGAHTRINQNGPRESGWRVTAQDLNLNRDYLKADAPEMQAWLRLFARWLPDLLIDCHVTDGADFQYTLTYITEVYGSLDPGLTRWTRDVFVKDLDTALTARGLPLAPYVSFRKWNDPRSGLESWVSTPRFSTGYASAQNRASLLVETHMLKDYRTRVEATYALLREALGVLGREHARLRRLDAQADSVAAAPAFRAAPFPLAFDGPADSTSEDFLGKEYTITTSDLTGGPWIRYRDKPEVWHLTRYLATRPAAIALLPAAYVIPPQWSAVAERLALHGVAMRRLVRDTALPVRLYRLKDPKWQEAPYEGHHPLTCGADTLRATRTYPAGSFVIDMSQRTARVIADALEPLAPDSFLRWGFFDAIFEQKEYAESYVMEAKAREMLAADPGLQGEFERKKAADPEFAKSQRAQLNWFLQRSPWWDPEKDLYPVGAITDAAAVPR